MYAFASFILMLSRYKIFVSVAVPHWSGSSACCCTRLLLLLAHCLSLSTTLSSFVIVVVVVVVVIVFAVRLRHCPAFPLVVCFVIQFNEANVR